MPSLESLAPTRQDSTAAPAATISIAPSITPSATLTLTPAMRLTAIGLSTASRAPELGIDFSDDAVFAMERSRAALRRAISAGCPVYGLTTGFGPHVRYGGDADPERQGEQLTAHLCAGFGDPAPREIVRAAMIIRLRTMALGRSGVDPAIARAIAGVLATDLTPVVPEHGSVGASGDLVPLAHAARCLMGMGEATIGGRRMPAADALEIVGLRPVQFSARDALGFVNGTSFMTAYLAHAIARGERLLALAEGITGWMYRQLGARASALDPRLHEARSQPGQVASARAIAHEASRHGHWEQRERPLQEVYSIRCAPQVLGACRDALEFARDLCEREINGVSDNPVIDADALRAEDIVMHGGNFQGQQIAFAADALAAALAQVGVLADRQIAAIVEPEVNDGAPMLLAMRPGESSGIAGAQLCATALTNTLRHNAAPSSFSSIPTNGRNQDIVSMGLHAARNAFAQLRPLAGVLAVQSICLAQLDALRRVGRCAGPTTEPPAFFPGFEPMDRDRPLDADIERIANAYLGLPHTTSVSTPAA